MYPSVRLISWRPGSSGVERSPEKAGPQDWLPVDHLAYHFRDVVSELDLRAIENKKSYETRGAAGFHPRMIVPILMYAWSNKIHSLRQIAKLCIYDLGGRYMAARHKPDFRVISRFQLLHGDRQVIVACDLTNQAADAPHLPSMLEQVAQRTIS